MARLITGTLVSDQSLPWFWTTVISCPRCTAQFVLTPEDTMPGLVTNLGASGSLAFGWKQLVEGNPATAPFDTANQHVDPAQVVGPCPQCGYNPIAVHGPRYGTTKLTLNVNPTTSAMQDWLALGVVSAGFMWASAGWLAAILQDRYRAPIQLDATGMYAASVRRRDDGTFDAAWPYALAAPGQRRTPDEAQQLDSALVTFLTGYGLLLT